MLDMKKTAPDKCGSSRKVFCLVIVVYKCQCFSFQDRGKRLKLQQFVVKKATSLYDASLLEVDSESQDRPPGEEGEFTIIIE
jgi:hypothetical protein